MLLNKYLYINIDIDKFGIHILNNNESYNFKRSYY